MVKRSRSTLLLIEQIIVIAVFAFCAAVCVNIIVSSFIMTQNAVHTRNALAVAESAAESFKAFDGDADRVFVLVGTYFDENWRQTTRDDAIFALNLDIQNQGEPVVFAHIVVEKIGSDEPLVELNVAARRRVVP